ncbi:MAG TPA: DUF4383 domain-containing protein [Pseudonocardiaceae bacterium]|jgi:hypothetical protein|nr:DUF4383 domain-containing protein [Pseudonocardiaceae bacterium]
MGTRDKPDARHPIFWVHRIGAVIVGLGLWIFGIFGFINRVGFFTTHGGGALGMSGNGLLATLSLVVGAVLIGAGLRGGPVASTTTAVLGGLFLLSGLVNLAVLRTPLNLLSFRMPNVVFSLVVGVLLLMLGLYGRASGGLPPDNPYLLARHGRNRLTHVWHDDQLVLPEPMDADAVRRRLVEIDELARAEYAVAEGEATPEQAEEVVADSEARAVERRRLAWQRAEHRTGRAEHPTG